ncbi:hypothetical protein D0962_15965 [Leptolyngbyaceae cyanobacterium CCMR0082]|uniref:Uncharacterized protein n=1 Tax=Adonisia turfae CCMR0082 TaxID=2304604 RepID=A0A6M0S715_9CYAN|nr:hypothetical protein [Adonisia turfae]MDV3349527.1 hypothetical protein [Leptothoe sp. LEGE 181152]NEZ64268.1 hypothetical protein [Adonisia turfae CCMR0082]
MPAKMDYGDFTISDVKKQFAVNLIEDQALFTDVQGQNPPQWLSDFLEIRLPLADAIGTEKAKSEFIVAPILSAARELLNRQV